MRTLEPVLRVISALETKVAGDVERFDALADGVFRPLRMGLEWAAWPCRKRERLEAGFHADTLVALT